MQKTKIKITTRLFSKELNELQRKLGITFIKNQRVLLPSNLSGTIVEDFCLAAEDEQIIEISFIYLGHDEDGGEMVVWELVPEDEIIINRFMPPSENELIRIGGRNESCK